MSKRTILVILFVVAAFAIVVGGMLWPRPQFQRGPWAPAPVDTVATDPAF
jgi:hypothetical protein